MSESWEDPIVAEVRRIRDAHAARFNYDLEAIFRDIKEQERKSGRTFVSLPAKRIPPDSSGENGTARQGAA